MSFTIKAVGRSILASSRRCTGRVAGSCRLREEAGVFGLGRQHVLLQHARSSWSTSTPGLRGDLAGSLGGVGVELRRCLVLGRSASSRGNGEKASTATGVEEEDAGVSNEDGEDGILIGDSAWKEILDPHAPEYDKWVGVSTDEGKKKREKIVDVSHIKSALLNRGLADGYFVCSSPSRV